MERESSGLPRATHSGGWPSTGPSYCSIVWSPVSPCRGQGRGLKGATWTQTLPGTS